MPLNTKRPEVGDLAYHKSGLDPREVTAVSENATFVKLDILGKETDWLNAVNYTFEAFDG
jgi:hypothetical protein